ncbi:MAG: DUF4392 domain-containing protein [Synergistetes bacterium]|nr:DUF4392 domain-containing protein [Synergistota bacterium]
MTYDISRWFLRVESFIARDMGKRGISSLYVKGDLEKAVKALVASDSVLITSGFAIKKGSDAFPETDGPMGVATLVRALLRLGKRVSVITDGMNAGVIEVAMSVLGCSVPVGIYGSKENVRGDILFSIERPGRAKDGHYYSMQKEDITEWVAPIDEIFLKEDNPSIGVGDGGNEIGMGKLYDQLMAYGMDGRFISVVPTTHLIVCGVSNWGAYGVVAGLQCITGEELMHTVREEKLLLESVVDAGAIDGVKKENALSVDGIELSVHQQVVEELWTMLSDF